MYIEEFAELTNKLTARGIGYNRKEHYKANPESYQRRQARARQNITCDICGSNTDRGHIARHKKSKYCRSFAIEKI